MANKYICIYVIRRISTGHKRKRRIHINRLSAGEKEMRNVQVNIGKSTAKGSFRK